MVLGTRVRPHLEYCSSSTQVWRPYLIKDIEGVLEGVQWRPTNLVHGIADFKYDDRLKRLRLVRLLNRRLRSDLIETYKILNGNYCINRELFLWC